MTNLMIIITINIRFIVEECVLMQNAYIFWHYLHHFQYVQSIRCLVQNGNPLFSNDFLGVFLITNRSEEKKTRKDKRPRNTDNNTTIN